MRITAMPVITMLIITVLNITVPVITVRISVNAERIEDQGVPVRGKADEHRLPEHTAESTADRLATLLETRHSMRQFQSRITTTTDQFQSLAELRGIGERDSGFRDFKHKRQLCQRRLPPSSKPNRTKTAQ